MNWSKITDSRRYGPSITYKGRKYAIYWFAQQTSCWALYKGHEVFIYGTHVDDRGEYGLIKHPTDADLGKIVDMRNVTVL